MRAFRRHEKRKADDLVRLLLALDRLAGERRRPLRRLAHASGGPRRS